MEQTLLEAVADYASISLVNERLFRAVETKCRGCPLLAKNNRKPLFQSLRQAVQNELDGILYPLGLMLTGKTGPLSAEQRKALASANAAAQRLSELVVNNMPSGE